MILKLGTRRSLLALAQSGWVARQIEMLNPGVTVELVGMDTQGDKIVDIPLRQAEGKEFFVKELDESLKSGATDLSVHSMKDLSLDRPSEFITAAVPLRADPRDVILFHQNVVEKLKRGSEIVIGTSSPRRLDNLPQFLERALPSWGRGPAKIQWSEIRGNINTRLARVVEPEGSARKLDGVVLALAGLGRLFDDPTGEQALRPLLEKMRWMVLPLQECPTAPAQGALAIECRKNDQRTQEILKRLHHAPTLAAVQKERSVLQEWGGGCHQKLGATALSHGELGDVMWVRGTHPNEKKVNRLDWTGAIHGGASNSALPWNSSEHRSEWLDEVPLEVSVPVPTQNDLVFVAHSRALPLSWVQPLSGGLNESELPRVWVAGTSTWFSLAEKGIWVEGSSESMGLEFLHQTWGTRVLQIPGKGFRIALTHAHATETWDSSWKVIATYKLVAKKPPEEAIRQVQQATHIYWGSYSQYQAVSQVVHGAFHVQVSHACGPGKTAKMLRDSGIKNLSVFPSSKAWKGVIK